MRPPREPSHLDRFCLRLNGRNYHDTKQRVGRWVAFVVIPGVVGILCIVARVKYG